MRLRIAVRDSLNVENWRSVVSFWRGAADGLVPRTPSAKPNVAVPWALLRRGVVVVVVVAAVAAALSRVIVFRFVEGE